VRRASGALVLLAGVALAARADGKPPTVKEVMARAHDGPSSLLAVVGKALKADEPDWPAVQKRTGELAELVAGLEKNDPPLGDRESWRKLSRKYLDQARALDAAARERDRGAARSAKAKLDASCLDCHKAHRPPDDP
jgi:hypothetical protein